MPKASSQLRADVSFTSLDDSMEDSEDFIVLPDVNIPPDFQEDHVQSEPITYFLGKSKRGADQLISSDGYSYNKFRNNKNGTTRWQCVVRNKQIDCRAQVTQSNDTYLSNDILHVHPPVPSAIEKNCMIIKGIEAALAHPDKSGAAIVKTLQHDDCAPELQNFDSMARRLNRHRGKTRPKKTQSLEEVSIDLPDVKIPPDFQESLLSDHPSLQDHAQSEPITYFLGKSKRGSDQLISSDGYSYNKLRSNKNGTTRWQCVVRNKQIDCPARVTQSNDTYLSNDVLHVHPPVPSAIEKNCMIIKGIEAALSHPDKSGAEIAKTLQHDDCAPELQNINSMARRLNRHREKTRPKKPQTSPQKTQSLEEFSIDLPDVKIPPDFQESFLSDHPSLEDHAQSEPITYFLGKSTRGSDQLISSDGYSYNKLRSNKNGTTRWQCVVRNKQIDCRARVTQSDDTYLSNNVLHVHPPVPSAIEKNCIIIKGIEAALAHPNKSGAEIAKTLQHDDCAPELQNIDSMARRLNRHREKTRPKKTQTRPKKTQSLEEFSIDLDHNPGIFDTWEVRAKSPPLRKVLIAFESVNGSSLAAIETDDDYLQCMASEMESVSVKVEPIPTWEIREKLLEGVKSSFGKKEEGNTSDKMSLLPESCLRELFEDFAIPCRKCKRKYQIKYVERYGNNIMQVSCDKCGLKKDYPPKSLIEGEEFTQATMNLIYECLEDGRGYIGYQRVCSNLGIQPVTKNSYYKIKSFIGSMIFEKFESKHNATHMCLVSYYKSLERHPDKNAVLNIDVSFDGFWLTTGHLSNIFIGIVIDSYTGFVLDFHVVSNYCVTCTRLNEMEKGEVNSDEYDEQMRKHSDNCNKNFDGSADAMEGECARVLWGRSEENFNLRYVNFIGDGYSSAYFELCSMNNEQGPYEVNVEKLDCISHVGKRFDAKLRLLKKGYKISMDEKGKITKQKVLGVKNKLSDNVIEQLSNYYTLAVRNSAGSSIKELKDNFMAIFYHCSSSDASPKHQLCPEGHNSYCFYNAALAKNEEPKSHKDMIVFIELDADERKVVQNAFREMSSDNLLEKCLSGKKHDQIESLHSKVCTKLKKEKNYGLTTVQELVCLTAMQHNVGYKKSCVISDFGFGEESAATKELLEILDKERRRHFTEGVQQNGRKREGDDDGSKRAKKKRKVHKTPDDGAGAH